MIKTKLQNQVIQQGIVDCARQIVTGQGARGLYQGLAANLIGIIPEKAIKLTVNDLARAALCADGQSPEHLSISRGVIAGGIAGTCQVVATCPMELVKINMQLDSSLSLSSTVRKLGMGGLYQGTTVTLLRDVPFSMIFFPTHAFLKSLMSENGPPKFQNVFLSGIAAGCFAAGFVTPMDVIKTRLQANPLRYKGILHCATEIAQKEGAAAFYKGIFPRCMIVAPLFGITLFVYEFQQRYIQAL